MNTPCPKQAVAHLNPDVWQAVTRRWIAKAIAEFAHELLVAPRKRPDSEHYVLETETPDIEYHFEARVFALDHWRIDPHSLRRVNHGAVEDLDAFTFVIDLRDQLGLTEDTLSGYLHQVAGTLYAWAYVEANPAPPSEALAHSSFQQIERSLHAGHPIFAANAGRLGFSAIDYTRYAPEAAQPFCLEWLAAHRSRVDLACCEGTSYDSIVVEELGAATIERFRAKLERTGEDPEQYVFIPVHPWQLRNKLAYAFADDFASNGLVHLGTSPDQYQPQQSIRTFYNLSEPSKHYVKTALSIVNMGFTRGLSTAMGPSSAAVNDWLRRLIQDDATLARANFRVLHEVAFVGYRNAYFEAASERRSDANKEMLAALWRESPTKHVGAGQQLMSMAALLHIDARGNSLLSSLIATSNFHVDEWLRHYLQAYLVPLLHCFYEHHLVFTPHCENTILLLERGNVVGCFIKDIGEDIGVLNPKSPLPKQVARLAIEVPEEVMPLAIFTDVFDGVFRFVADVLDRHEGYEQERFWTRVAETIQQYQDDHPKLATEFARYDLFAPTFLRNCLNRLQLRNNREMVDLNAPNPADSLQFVGTLHNPIAHLSRVSPTDAHSQSADSSSPTGKSQRRQGSLSTHSPIRTEPFVFERVDESLGPIRIRRLNVPKAPMKEYAPELTADLLLVHDWVRREYAEYWGLVGKSPEEVARAYIQIAKTADVYLGHVGQQPAFLVECYDPKNDPIANHYPVKQRDRGMHLLVGPPVTERIPGYTWAVFRTVMDFLFADPSVNRVVVEPDVRNKRIHVLNLRAGFVYDKVVQLPHKSAHLAFCTREQYRGSTQHDERGTEELRHEERLDNAPFSRNEAGVRWSPMQIGPEVWRFQNRLLATKVLAEFAHERLIEPGRVPNQPDIWSLQTTTRVGCRIEYRFRARVMPLDDWRIQATSLERHDNGQPTPVDAVALILELADAVGLSGERLGIYLEEILRTLGAAAYRRVHESHTASELAGADFQSVEASMTEGHPGFVANSGRIGFNLDDYLAYAPEARRPIRLVWLAAHARHTQVSVGDDLTYDSLIRYELPEQTTSRFDAELRERDVDPRHYVLFPVHPWQWFNWIAQFFAADIARGDLICLGFGDDRYQAQQSIRTLYNTDQPRRCYVKMALSVLNMGFVRGMSPEYMRCTPAINDWVNSVISNDAYLQSRRFSILRELASVGYESPILDEGLPRSAPHRKLLAALWRQSPTAAISPRERLMTMAALLHEDADGDAVIRHLIHRSGLNVDRWLDNYLDAYLLPILHCLCRYDLAFMPHGENIILVLEDDVPKRVFLKDIAEETVLMNEDATLPDAVARIRAEVPEALKVLSVFTDVFDGFFRHLSRVLETHLDFPTTAFWQSVGRAIREYQTANPDLAAKFTQYDMFAGEFPHSCLNRLQLRDNRQMVDLSDPAGSLAFAGSLRNPIAT